MKFALERVLYLHSSTSFEFSDPYFPGIQWKIQYNEVPSPSETNTDGEKEENGHKSGSFYIYMFLKEGFDSISHTCRYQIIEATSREVFSEQCEEYTCAHVNGRDGLLTCLTFSFSKIDSSNMENGRPMCPIVIRITHEVNEEMVLVSYPREDSS